MRETRPRQLAQPINLLGLRPTISDSSGGEILRVDVANAAKNATILWRTSDGRRTTLACSPKTTPADFSFTPDGGAPRTVTWALVEYVVPH